MISPRLLIAYFVLISCLTDYGSSQERKLELGTSPINNPLKGLVPYARPVPNRFPNSMEFGYVGLARLVVGKERYDWRPLEELLDDIASRGNQAVIRIYMEYPGKSDGIPSHLVEQGLKVHTYTNTNTAPLPPTEVTTPDYEAPNLRETLRSFIKAFGAKYDGDARLGFITAGLLGTWGEWHTYPRNDLWASKQTQTIVLDAYEAAFKLTPILVRYPAGESNYDKAPNTKRPFGYHDDSLCWATLQTGKKEDDWFFVPALNAAGPEAVNKWQVAPIGGEIRPEVWGKIFDKHIDIPQAQPFDQCAAALHLSWTMDTGMFREVAPKDRYVNAIREVTKLGYEFYVDSCRFPMASSASSIDVSVHVVNRGIAPMYHRWPIELTLATESGRTIKRWKPGWVLAELLPDRQGREFKCSIDLEGISPGRYFLLMRVVNPLTNGKPLQFANREWGTVVKDQLTLGSIAVE